MKSARKGKADKPPPAERRSPDRTQWAAQFAVASELCKRDCQVAFTLGNNPTADLMAISPKGVPFTVDVKGLYKKNFWPVRPKKAKPNLFYILALVLDEEQSRVPNQAQNRFFILTQDQANEAIEAEEALARTRAVDRGRSVDNIGNFPGITWGQAEASENAWDILPK
jgi:hypothetical protein